MQVISQYVNTASLADICPTDFAKKNFDDENFDVIEILAELLWHTLLRKSSGTVEESLL